MAMPLPFKKGSYSELLMGCVFGEYVYTRVSEVFCGAALHFMRPRLPWVQSRRQTVLEAGDRRFGAVFELVDGGARGSFAFRVEVEVQVGLSLYADAAPHGDAVGGRWALGVGLG